jgi:Lysylphosphatidylglycerol synthase TM region
MKFVYRLLYVLVGIFFLYTFYSLTKTTEKIEILSYLQQISAFKLAISLFAYLFSHVLRSVRVGLMIGKQDFSFLSLINAQFYTNGVNLILPFKLGEVYRIIEFNKLFKDSERTFITVLAERTLDFIILFVGLFIFLYLTDYGLIDLHVTVIIGTVFIVSVIIIYYVLPENLRSFNLFLAKRYTNNSVTKILSVSSKLYTVINNIKIILRRKSSTIVLLTVLIWASEIVGLFFIYDFLLQTNHLFLLAFFVFLSSLIPSGSLGLGGLQFAFYMIYLAEPSFPYLSLSLTYQLCIFSPAIFIAFFLYVRKRLKDWKP